MPRGEARVVDHKSAALELALPIVALALVGTVATLLADHGVAHRFEGMGEWFFIVSGAGVAALGATCTLLWLQRRGRNVPIALTLFFATLPWLTGLGGMRYGMHRAGQAIEGAEWSAHGAMALRGYAEASVSAAFGQLLSMALLCAIAIVHAVRSSGERSNVFAGVVVAAAVVAFVGPAMAIPNEAAASMMLVPVVAASFAFAACAGRPGAPGVALSSFLATVAACSATMLDVRYRAFEISTGVDSTQRLEVFELAALSDVALSGASSLAIGAIGVGAALLVGEAVRRAKRAVVVRMAGLALVVLAVLALHRVAIVASMRTIERWTSLPWENVDGFILAEMGGEWGDEPWAVVTTDALWMGEIQLPDDELGEAVERERERRRELEAQRYEYVEETPEWLLEAEPAQSAGRGKRSKVREVEAETSANRYAIADDDLDEETREEARELARWVGRYYRPAGEIEGCALGGRPVSVAIDARVPLTRLFSLFQSVGSITIIGRHRGPEPPDSLRELPVVANAAGRDRMRSVSVFAPIAECAPNAGRDILLTATLGTQPVETFREYETGVELSLSDVLETRLNDQPNAQVMVLVGPEEGATVQHLADLGSVLHDNLNRVRMVLVPELPQPAPVSLPTEIAEAVRDVQVDLGHAWPRGPLVRRELGMEQRRPELDECARRALSATPELAADMDVFARIGSDGQVRSARTVGGSAALRPMRRCIADVVRGWTFPSRDRETRLHFSVTLGEPDRGFREG